MHSFGMRVRTVAIALPLVNVTRYDYNVVMKRVNIADLKARLSEHLRYVRRGHTLTILDRDTPVATINPVSQGTLLSIRSPAVDGPTLQDIPIPKALKLKVDPVALLLAEREGGR